MTHICVSRLTIIGSYNDLSPSWRQAIIWTNAGILLTHWGWVTQIYVSKLTITGSDNGLAPGRRHAIFWTSAGILLIGTLPTNFSEIQTSSFNTTHLKMSSAKWRSICLGLNVLIESLGTNFEMYTFSFRNMYLEMSSGKWRPFRLGLNVLTIYWTAKLDVLAPIMCRS